MLREPVLERYAGAGVRDHNIHAGDELGFERAIDIVVAQTSERGGAGAEGGECLVGAMGCRMHNRQPKRAIGSGRVGLLCPPDLLEPLGGELLQQRVATQRAPDGQLVVESGGFGGVRVVGLIRHGFSRRSASREDRRSRLRPREAHTANRTQFNLLRTALPPVRSFVYRASRSNSLSRWSWLRSTKAPSSSPRLLAAWSSSSRRARVVTTQARRIFSDTAWKAV